MTQPTQPLRVLELCAGIGGFGLACEMVGGYEVVGQVEIDRFCQAVLAKHWPDVRRMGDIREVVGDEFGEIDIIVGGIPCQGNSLAGKRRGRDDPRNLWPDAARIIRRVKPRWVVVENVAGLLSVDVADPGQPGGVMGDILRDLAQMGYAASWGVWGATDVGAPHQRDRVFIVGYNATVVDANRRRCHGREGGASGGEQYAGISAGQEGPVIAEAAGPRSAMGNPGSVVVRAGADQPGRVGETPATAESAGQSALCNAVACAGDATLADADSDRRGDGAHQSQPGAERRRPANPCAGRELANANRSGRGSHERDLQTWQPNVAGVGVGLADADRARLPQRDGRDATRRACAATGGDGTGQTQPAVCRGADGLPRQLDGHRWPAGPGAAQHAWEAPHTVTACIPNRAARLKALGNAIVPQQAAVLLAAIVTWDQMEATA